MCTTIDKPPKVPIIIKLVDIINDAFEKNLVYMSTSFSALVFYDILQSAKFDCQFVDGYILNHTKKQARFHSWVVIGKYIFDIRGDDVDDKEDYVTELPDDYYIADETLSPRYKTLCQQTKIEIQRYFDNPEQFWNDHPDYGNVRNHVLKSMNAMAIC